MLRVRGSELGAAFSAPNGPSAGVPGNPVCLLLVDPPCLFHLSVDLVDLGKKCVPHARPWDLDQGSACRGRQFFKALLPRSSSAPAAPCAQLPWEGRVLPCVRLPFHLLQESRGLLASPALLWAFTSFSGSGLGLPGPQTSTLLPEPALPSAGSPTALPASAPWRL